MSKFHKLLLVLSLFMGLASYDASATPTSTINPNVPAQNSPLSSSVIRNNFAAAVSDINALWVAATSIFSSGSPGIAPATGGVDSTHFLSANGSWLVPAGSGSGTTWPANGTFVISNGTNSPGGISLSGDLTANTTTGAATLSSVNSNVGSFTCSNVTVNAKGLVTAAASGSCGGAVSSVFGRTGSVSAQSGDYTTAQVTESGNLYFTTARAIASALTGYVSGAGTVSATDSILAAIQKINGNDALKAPIASPTFTGTVTLPAAQVVNGVTLSNAGASTSFLNNAGSYSTPAGGGNVNAGTTNQVPYYASSGTTVSPATLGNDLAIVTGVLNTTQPADRLVTTATDTITATDCGTIVAYNRATAIAVSIAAASSTGLTQGCTFTVNNYGAGTATITPTTSTINGGATLAIPANTGCLIRSDSTNYKVDLSACSAVVTATGAVSSVTGDNFYFGNTLSTGAVTLTQKNHTANTVTGSLTATVNSDLAVPSCSSASSALTWTSGTGFGCNTISGSGTVNAGTQYQLGYYATSTTAISGNSGITTDASNNLYVTTGAVAIGSTVINTGVSLDLGSKTNAILVPKGTTGQEPTGIEGMLRYNTTTHGFEGYSGSSPAWGAIGGGSSISVTSGSASIVINPNPGISAFTVATTDTPNPQTGTTYTVVAGDMTKTILSSNAASIATTLPQTTTTGFGSGAAFSLINIGTSINTMTPTTSNVNGLSKETLPAGWGSYNVSDGTNYGVFYSNPSPYNVGVPAVTSCGGGTLVTGSTNNKWTVTGITAATSCTVTFSAPLPPAPVCTFNTSTGLAVGGIPSTAAVTTTMTAFTGTLQGLCW